MPLFVLYNWFFIGVTALYRSSAIVFSWLILDQFWDFEPTFNLEADQVWAPSPPPPSPHPPPGASWPPPAPPDQPYSGIEWVKGRVVTLNEWGGFGAYMSTMFGVYCAVHLVMVVLAYVIEIGLKWLLLGRRKVGVYPWETSSYCMRWNLYLAGAVVRSGLVSYLHGSAYLVWYFRALGCTIGKDVCLFPTGSDPMMTEPDLVTIGDGACLNAAFVICHTNTKGSYSLNTVTIGPYATLRTWSRLMAGGTLAEGARLLEHTLALVGDHVEPGVIWQGWPVKAMLATSEFWRLRRNQIKLGRKQPYRLALGGQVVPVLFRGDGKVRPAPTRALPLACHVRHPPFTPLPPPMW